MTRSKDPVYSVQIMARAEAREEAWTARRYARGDEIAFLPDKAFQGLMRTE